jgi:hypothetical protein
LGSGGIAPHILILGTRWRLVVSFIPQPLYPREKAPGMQGNACYYSVQNILSSRLISKNLKIKIYKILPVVLYGCETWSLTLEEEHRLRVFENRVLRRIFGPKRDEDGSWRK